MRINDFYNILELIKQDVLHSEAEYLKLLKVVGNNQRYDFRSQLSIYDRNPEATACAKFDYWRERFNRTVMRGQKGIPILEDYGTYKKVDYIFDISQTVSRNRDVNEVNLWRFDKEAHQDVLKEMIKSEGYEESESILENIFSLSRLYGDEKIDSLMNELGISTNLCELEKNKLNFSRKAMEEFLGNGFINNDYNGKVSFQCQPRAYEPNLMNIIINIKDIGETIIVWGSIFNAIGKFVKKCKGYEASINILYFKNKIEKMLHINSNDLNNIEKLVNKIEIELDYDIYESIIKKVAIIGNGFDLSHGLKTKYSDFFDKNINDNVVKEFNKLIKYHNKNKKDNLYWCDIEKCMKSVALGIFEENFEDDISVDLYRTVEEKMCEINMIYNNISSSFVEYLKNNVMNETVNIKDSILEEFDKDTLAINFNYTDTIKLYTDNIQYIHGSISEDKCIVLGFHDDNVPDSFGGKFIEYRKDVRKEILNFLRFLKKKSYEYNDIMLDEFMEQLYGLFSDRGEYLMDENGKKDSSCKYKKISKEILEYAKSNDYNIYKDETDYSKVEEIIILGHSLESDTNYLRVLSSKSPLLKRVILYKFDGEDISDKVKSIYNIFGDIELVIKSY